MSSILWEAMFAIYMSAETEKVERYFDAGGSPNPNLGCLEEAVLKIENHDEHFTNDDLGLFWHLIDGGTLLTLAISAKHNRRFEMMELLIRRGAKVNDPKNIQELIYQSDLELYKFMVEHGAELTSNPRVLLGALRKGSIELLKYLYEVVGIRLSRGDYDVAQHIVQTRCQSGCWPEIEVELVEYLEKFAKRERKLSFQ